ncbi:signal transducing adapter molecule 1-like [Musca domestica]|uniref:Signal transducing adapter molecule 1-like n=1 Tax=Musca domestica TaxID=7370 RepID=A0ABM3UV05_MUSDO|nr:signal transducing adapter molecule 1-like [Musca domestica]
MGIFGQSSGFDADVEKATSESNTNENWALILDVCDKTSSNSRNAKECLKAIMKRMGHNDPHVVMQAITLLDACVNNCGKPFHLEIASREFQNEFLRLLGKVQPKVAARMCHVLKGWAEGDFKSDPELNLIPSLYTKLRQENYDFSGSSDKPTQSTAKMVTAKDPNATRQQEEDDLAKAIELSLKDVKNSPKNIGSSSGGSSSSYPSLYPSVSNNATSHVSNAVETRQVRALYDFEAAEENELTFAAGDIIHVLDDSDPNWWKGFNQRGEGLFPSNFVTADLSVDPQQLEINQQHKMKKSSQFEEDTKELQHKTEAAAAAAASQKIEIDEKKIDRLLHLINEANPEDPSQDTEEMLRLEQEVHQMGPLIDTELERVDRKHAQLSQLSSDLVDAINLYHSLMRDDRNLMGSPYGVNNVSSVPGMPNYHNMPQHGYNMLYGSNAGFIGGFNSGPHSLQGSLPSVAFPTTANYQSMNISMQPYQSSQSNSQSSQHQGLHGQSNSQIISQQPLSLPQNHSQQQIYMASNGQIQGSSANIPVSVDTQQLQTYQVPQHYAIQTQSPSVPTNTMPTNQQAPLTHPTQNHPQSYFSSPQQSSLQQTPQSYVNSSSSQLLSDPTPIYVHQNLPTNGPPQSTFVGPQQQASHLPPPLDDQFGQLQHQMANMTVTSQPYQTNMQQNIPVYNQQR